jgi:hypothetical protein
MPTGVLGVASRQDPRQVQNSMKKTINWNDAASGVAVPMANYLPQGAFITGCWVEVVTAFNGTTPTVTVGTNASTYNNIVAAADVTWTAAAVTPVSRGLGRGLAAAGDVLPYVTWNATGAPSAGQAVVVLEFEGGWQS